MSKERQRLWREREKGWIQREGNRGSGGREMGDGGMGTDSLDREEWR